MAPARNAESMCGYTRPVHVDEGTCALARTQDPQPVSWFQSWPLVDQIYRTSYVYAAWDRARMCYAAGAIARHIGEDFLAIVQGILVGMLLAIGTVALGAAIGALIGAGVGALAGGIGAAPGAVVGADIGVTVAEGLLAWMGLAFLAKYLIAHVGELGRRLGSGVVMAWESRGAPCVIDAAAREMAEAIGIFFSLFVQALVAYLMHSSAEGGTAAAMQRLRGSLLFKYIPKLEPWLVENFPRLRARFFKLQWEVLGESPTRIPGSSIPESMTLRVGRRVFEVIRNKDKLDAKGEPIGPATKHLGEKAQGASPWAKAAETDFPISSLAAALDQAEAQLMFQPPNPRAQPVKLDNWELLIDTTKTPWRVFHAVYTDKPRW